MRLARRGELLSHHKDTPLPALLKMNSVIETYFLSVKADMNLRQMVDTISKSSRNLFPALDIMFRPDLYKRMYVSRFMAMPPAKLCIGDSMDHVMKTFDDTGAWNLPVVDADGKYVGFVSKSKIFNSYRRVLRHYSED